MGFCVKRRLLVSMTLVTVNAHSAVCLVPVEKIKIADIFIGESVNDLARRHKAVEVDNSIINKLSDKSRSVFVDSKFEKEWFYGEPISGINFINYNRDSYKINAFGVALDFDNFNFEKVKRVIIDLYDLPKINWTYHKEQDHKYGEAEEYNYKCDGYTIRLAQSGLGTSIQMSAK